LSCCSLPSIVYASPFFCYCLSCPRDLHSFPTRRSSDLVVELIRERYESVEIVRAAFPRIAVAAFPRRLRQTLPEFIEMARSPVRSEEHTSELQSRENIVCRLLLEKKKPI